MNIKIYNSLTNQIEDFHPVKPQEISIYVCGPTVYNDIHIGNARPVVFFDTVARFFKYLGYNVRMVSNFTDIDDKIIMRAKELGISETEVAKHYIDEFCESTICWVQNRCLPVRGLPNTWKLSSIISKSCLTKALLTKAEPMFILEFLPFRTTVF